MAEMEVELEREIEEEVHENDQTFEESDDVTTLSGRLKALQSVTVFVQVRGIPPPLLRVVPSILFPLSQVK